MKKTTLFMLTAVLAAGAHAGLPHPAKMQQLQQAAVVVTAEGETPVAPPEGIEPEMYKFQGFDTYINQTKEAEVFVVRDGDAIYIQGLSIDYKPDGWVKGTLANGVASIPECYMGAFDFWGDSYDLYFDGATFAYDEASNTFTSAEGYTTTAEETVLDEYINVTLTGVVATPATPAMPEITEFTQDNYGYYIKMNIPTTDVDGNDIFPALLSYQLLYENADGATGVYEFTTDNYVFLEQDMTQVPYNYTDSYDIDKGGRQVYLYADDLEQWTAIGVKSIYTVGEVANESEVFWFPTSFDPTAVADVRAAQQVEQTRYFDLQGRPVGADIRGVVIQVTRLADGTTQATKLVR